MRHSPFIRKKISYKWRNNESALNLELTNDIAFWISLENIAAYEGDEPKIIPDWII